MSLEQLANEQRKYNEYAILNEALSVSNVKNIPKSRSIITPITKEMIKDYNDKLDAYSQKAGTPQFQIPNIDLEDQPEYLEIPSHKIRRTNVRYRQRVHEYSTEIERLRNEIMELEDYLRNSDADYTSGVLIISAERHVELQNEIAREIDQRSAGITELERRIHVMTTTGIQQEDQALEQNARADIVKRQNREKLRNYAEEARALNQSLKLEAQGPNESNEEYAERIENLKYIVEPERLKSSAESEVIKIFKKNMKDIIRNEYIIQEVLSDIGIDNAFSINKIFSAFKKKMLETYGYNNESIDADLIADTITTILTGDFKSVELGKDREEIKDIREEEGYVEIEDEEGDVLEYEKDGESLWFLLYVNNKGGKGKSARPFIMFSESDIKGTFRPIEKTDVKTVLRISRKPSLEALYQDLVANEMIPHTSGALYGPKQGKHGVDKSKRNIVGWGVMPASIPDKAKLGKLMIHPKKLFYNNMLVIKDHNGGNIKGIPNLNVSEDLVKLLFRILKNESVTEVDIKNLKTPEQNLYNLIIKIAELHKTHPHTGNKTVEELKNKLSLIEGEIEAGNDNKSLIKDAEHILDKLYKFGVIAKKDAINYLKQLNN